MISVAIAFVVSLLFSAILTPVLRDFAVRKNWVDVARSTRKVHTRPVPRVGGIAIAAAFFVPLVGLLLVDSGVGRIFFANPRIPAGIFCGGLLVALVGIYDDLKGLGALKKFGAQFLVAAVMYGFGFAIERISTPWGAVGLGALSLPFTLIWIVGVINAVNLIDGLDGLASGVSFVAVATIFVIAAASGNVIMMLLMAALAGSLLGFLIYNFNPASIFMGDSGSMFLGFVLATGSVVTSSKSSTTVAMLVPILALGLPIMDTLLAMARRALRGQSLMAADKEHVHHRLLALGLSQRSAVIVLYGVGVLFALAALATTFANGRQAAAILAMVVIVAAVFMRKLGYFSKVLFEDASAHRAHNLVMREQVRNVGALLREAATPAQAWVVIQPLAASLHASEVTLVWHSAAAQGGLATNRFEWRVDSRAECARTGASLPIRVGDQLVGELQLAWRDGRKAIERDDEIVLERLGEHLIEAAKRMDRQLADEGDVPLQKSA